VAEAERWIVPYEPPAPAPPAPTTRPRGRVLVVDDNPELRGYMAELLSPVHDVETAPDGQRALDWILQAAALPDLVVSDVMMPNLDGLGLVRALRATARTRVLPIILLSARAGQEASTEGLDSGADDYLLKPFSARELLARVRTHLELARMRRSWIAELERANRALDAFSTSVSHDLRAPLRVIDGFSRALDEGAGQLPPTARGHLGHIRKAVERMTALIDALLELGRVSGGAVQPTTEIDLSELASGVIAELRRAHPDRRVECLVEGGLTAAGDRRLLQAVLENLLGNAWKFTRPRAGAARIEVGRLPGVAPPTFFVRDNGAGFDMAYASRLFAPFQRLHRAEAFEGTGIGLATVQRIVERHGGEIWAEAAVDQGATFFFTLPGRSE
jgi:signal transduction histidine kinase